MSDTDAVRARYMAEIEKADRRAEMFDAVMTALEAALRGYDGTHPSHPHDRAVWLERILEAARAVVQRSHVPAPDAALLTLDARLTAVESHDPDPTDWPVKAGC